MVFYQLFHLILHEIDRFGCFMLKSGFFSKSLVLCLKFSKLILVRHVMRAYAFLRSGVVGRLDIWRPSKWRLSLSVSTESFLLILCLVKRSVTATR